MGVLAALREARHRACRSSCRPRTARSRPWSRRCGPAPSISSSSRSAPSGCRSRSRTRCALDALEDEVRRMKRRAAGTLGFRDLVDPQRPTWRACIRLAERAAKSTIPVLIEGESGVGKELLARAIQGSGERARQALRHRQLRRDPREPRRIDPVRPREGRLHGRDRAACRQVRRGRRRHAVPRRDRRAAARRAGEAAARHPGGRGRSRSARKRPVKVDIRLISATNRNLIDLVQGGPLPRGPLLPPQRLPDHAAAAARAARGHRRSRPPLHGALRGRGGQARRAASRPRRWRCSRATTGRATSASSRTRCSAPSCWPTATS